MMGAAFLFNRHLTKNDKWNFRMRYKMPCMIFMMGAAYLFNRHLGKKKKKNRQHLRMRHKTAHDVLDHLHDRSGFFVQRAPEKTNTKNRQNSNMRHKMTQDVLDELHDRSSFFVQHAPGKEKNDRWNFRMRQKMSWLGTKPCRHAAFT